MNCADRMVVRPIMLRRLGHVWDDAAAQVRREAATVVEVAGSGIDDLGRLNRFLVPALAGFLAAAHEAAIDCSEALEDAAEAARVTGEDIRLTDEGIAGWARSGMPVVTEVWA